MISTTTLHATTPVHPCPPVSTHPSPSPFSISQPPPSPSLSFFSSFSKGQTKQNTNKSSASLALISACAGLYYPAAALYLPFASTAPPLGALVGALAVPGAVVLAEAGRDPNRGFPGQTGSGGGDSDVGGRPGGAAVAGLFRTPGGVANTGVVDRPPLASAKAVPVRLAHEPRQTEAEVSLERLAGSPRSLLGFRQGLADFACKTEKAGGLVDVKDQGKQTTPNPIKGDSSPPFFTEITRWATRHTNARVVDDIVPGATQVAEPGRVSFVAQEAGSNASLVLDGGGPEGMLEVSHLRTLNNGVGGGQADEQGEKGGAHREAEQGS